MKHTAAAALVLCLSLPACVLSHEGNGPVWIGQPSSALVAAQGMPDRELNAPSGAEVYVYRQKSINGQNELCRYQYYIQRGIVVGFDERGAAVNCSGHAGEAR